MYKSWSLLGAGNLGARKAISELIVLAVRGG